MSADESSVSICSVWPISINEDFTVFATSFADKYLTQTAYWVQRLSIQEPKRNESTAENRNRNLNSQHKSLSIIDNTL